MQEFEDFVALRSQALPRTAYLLCGGGKGAAEDILQEVLVSMCGKWRRIRPSPGGARPRRAGERGREPAGGGVPQRVQRRARALGCGIGTATSQT